MKSQAPLYQQDATSHPDQGQPETDSALNGLTDVTFRYRLESGPSHSTWIVDCGYQTAGKLDIQAGPYTLTQYTKSSPTAIKAAERLCSLPTHPSVLRVDAVTSLPTSEHIWYEAAEAGSLADYCRARGQLPLEQVTTIARSLTEALSYLHEQELVYQNLSLEHCVFTASGEMKVLAPDFDVRTSPEATQQTKKADDIAACAAILWFCLTGKEPKAQRLRAPLSLSVPQASDALAQTLEDAIDLRANQPSLADIAALFDFTADSAPLELHLSAHESVLSRLPAYLPPQEKPSKPRLTRSPKVYGKPRNLSSGASPKAKPAPGGSKNITTRGIAIGIASVGVLALLSVLYPAIQNHNSSGSEAPTSQQTGSLDSSPHTATPENNHVAEQKIPVSKAPAELSDSQVEELAQQTSELVSRRSDVLASGQKNRVGEYAADGSELQKSDQELLTQEQASALSQMSSRLVSVESIATEKPGTYIVTATVEAQGYNPAGSEEELAKLGMVRQEGRIVQRVSLTLKASDRGTLIESARPITANRG